MPEIDIYEKAGARIFTNFDRSKVDDHEQKNLLVIPSSVYKGLTGKKRQSIQSSVNTGGVLASLDEKLMKAKHEIENYELNGSVQMYTFPYSSGLDIALIPEDKVDHADLSNELQNRYDFKGEITYVSSDNKTTIKRRLKKLKVEEPKFLMGDISILQKGTLSGSSELLAEVMQHGNTLPYSLLKEYFDDPVYPNTIVRFQGEKKGADTYGIVSAPTKRNKWGKILPVNNDDLKLEMLAEREYNKNINIGQKKFQNLYGISPRTMEQYIALQKGMLDPDISVLGLVGGAGSGKTLLAYVGAIALGLNYTKEELKERNWEDPFYAPAMKNPAEELTNRLHKLSVARKEGSAAVYEKIVLLKPDDPVGGREVGALPGDLWLKIKDHLKPYQDAHDETTLNDVFSLKDLILNPKRANDYGEAREKNTGKSIHRYGGKLSDKKEVVELTHISTFRGRSFENTLMLVDEAQNFSPNEMRTIVSRMGVGSKLVIMGDPGLQIDNRKANLTRNYNGLVQTLEHYLPKSYSMLINFNANFRSEMSEDSLEMIV